ncbi:MAG TPA: tryptophan--tRNA ligase [Thermotogota bacterium]|nr:tryptophan--tRNA ligase [Thermotogota bacterium]HRW91732.1 tryptophan--tRNA ligase [Thermotogota bacterium]
MRILSGTRPTGKLHIGHLVGILQNWVRLQEEGNETFFFVADWHALTTGFEDTAMLKENSRDIIRIFLGCGLDPEKSVLFVQSAIKEHAELALLFSMFVSIPRLERVPTYKDLKQEIGDQSDLNNAGFLIYPVLQAADILAYRAGGVPVGMDQMCHVELTREIARRFNFLYDCQVFPEPEGLLARFPKLPGTDGRKMSKSYGNMIYIESDPEELRQKIMPMITDPARKRKSDPGNPDVCPVWDYHRAFGVSPEQEEWIREGCTQARIGCVECKKELLKSMISGLQPVWERLGQVDSQKGLVEDVMQAGNAKARLQAQQTLQMVRDAMHLLF